MACFVFFPSVFFFNFSFTMSRCDGHVTTFHYFLKRVGEWRTRGAWLVTPRSGGPPSPTRPPLTLVLSSRCRETFSLTPSPTPCSPLSTLPILLSLCAPPTIPILVPCPCRCFLLSPRHVIIRNSQQLHSYQKSFLCRPFPRCVCGYFFSFVLFSNSQLTLFLFDVWRLTHNFQSLLPLNPLNSFLWHLMYRDWGHVVRDCGVGSVYPL